MTELLNRHLEQIALRMGGFLRGFDDPAVHVGTRGQFVRAFRRLLELPLIQDPTSGVSLSYVQALGVLRAPEPLTQAEGPLDVLMRGVGGPPNAVLQLAHPVTANTIQHDLNGLLREPELHFYFCVSDLESFLAHARQIADREGFDATGFHRLPLVPAVSSVLSYYMLRELASLDLVQSYQAEGTIRAIAPAGGD